MPVLPLSADDGLGLPVRDRGPGRLCPVGLGVLTGEISRARGISAPVLSRNRMRLSHATAPRASREERYYRWSARWAEQGRLPFAPKTREAVGMGNRKLIAKNSCYLQLYGRGGRN